jgi:DNA-directed RNA polymerase subunit beta'
MKDLLNFFDKPKDPISIEGVSVTMAAPDVIREWSFGEVKKPETINYRTFKPERDGLFCAKIFGPIKDYECICGKYKRMKHRGVVCEKCGVEVTLSKVRRERMGHIELATPVAHIWFLRSLPSRIGGLLDLSLKDLEKVLYNEAYIVTDCENTGLEGGLTTGSIITEQKALELREAGVKFKVGMGGEVVKDLLSKIDLDLLNRDLRRALKEVTTDLGRTRVIKRLKVVEALLKSPNKPEWFMMDVIPVLPPDLRPLVPLEAGRFATSDLNDLYRRVINRNNRLKRLKELNAPEIIIRNEKRMLQEAVDALFDNGRRGKVFTGANKRPLRSLSDMLKGKQGRFRQNLLGKRVDYSGRSVIVVGPNLKLHQCGLPKLMALELFKPFIYSRLIEKGHCTTIKVAKKMVDIQKQEVWDILEEVVREHPVLLNRAPTLHRLGIQAFEPILIEGKAIQLHPLVCAAFNADFDGDQMAVHVPLSLEAQVEARILVMSTNNILSPKDGSPIVVPSQDIVLGMYYMSRVRPFARGYGRIFNTREEAQFAYETNNLHLQAPIKIRINGVVKETTVGRSFVYDILPKCLEYEDINKILNKKELGKLIDKAYRRGSEKETVLFADSIMKLGYQFATKAGISINIKDMVVPNEKTSIIKAAQKEVDLITSEYNEGSITNGERYNKIVDVWAQTNERLSKVMIENLSSQDFKDVNGTIVKAPSFNSVFMMADSGARGSTVQIRQLAGMRGLMAKPSGEIIETPITSNFREGLSVLEYFASSHGARKGLADTALKTANSGYLTRRLVDVAQDGIIRQHDCGTTEGIVLTSRVEAGEIIDHVSKRVLGRVSLEPIPGKNGKILFEKNHLFIEKDVRTIIDEDIDQIKVRSVLTCVEDHGFCSLCFGRDLARGQMVSVGEAVGVIAAQSIGEPGTQLTMRTFHVGGTATAGTQVNKTEAKTSGIIFLDNLKTVQVDNGSFIVMNKTGEVVIKTESGIEKERYPAVYGATLFYKQGDKINVGDKLLEWDPFSMPLLSEVSGIVKFEDLIVGSTVLEQIDSVTGLTHRVVVETKDTSKQPRISIMDTNGQAVMTPGTKRPAQYRLPVGANITVLSGDTIKAGDVISKIQRETTKTKDITGGLPRVAELFEARKPVNSAQISDIAGTIQYGPEIRGARKIIVKPDDESLEPLVYTVPKGRYVTVNEGDYVRPGDQIMDGPTNPHDILRVLGDKVLARYIVDEIQVVYKLQGVEIDDKHIEVIVSQMLKKVEITDPGDSLFVSGDSVTKHELERVNNLLLAEKLAPSKHKPLLLGITKASLTTDSFISAASFQETTKVLTQAALEGKKDQLRGLKENVIMGRLVPAGTGVTKYRNLDAHALDDNYEESFTI